MLTWQSWHCTESSDRSIITWWGSKHTSTSVSTCMFPRISKTPPSSKRMSDRALPDLPNDSLGGSVQSSQKSLSSIGSSNNSKLSNTSFTKNNSVFVMDEDEEPEYHQTYAETDQLDTSLGWVTTMQTLLKAMLPTTCKTLRPEQTSWEGSPMLCGWPKAAWKKSYS